MTQCANYQGSHQANFACCSSRQKVKVQARKNKAAKKVRLKVKATLALESNKKDGEVVAISEQEMDTKVEE